MKRHKGLPTDLRKPIKLLPLTIPFIWMYDSLEEADRAFQSQFIENMKTYALERERKLDLLYQAHGVSREAREVSPSSLVATVLAERFLEGLHPARPKAQGRPSKWTAEHHFILWHEVQKRTKAGASIQQACMNLSSKKEWGSLLNPKAPEGWAKSLVQQYHLSQKSSYVRFVQDISRSWPHDEERLQESMKLLRSACEEVVAGHPLKKS